jgi:Secretory lipase
VPLVSHSRCLNDIIVILIIYLGSGLQAAYATLDSIRAVKNFANISGMDPDPQVGMYGYSGGGLSAVWVRLAPVSVSRYEDH